MRKAIIFILTLSFWGLTAPITSAQSIRPEIIDSFDVEIKIQADASFNVSEKIQYDFGAAQKHGIFRYIPIKYQARGGNYNLRVSDISVSNENGNSYNFTTSYPGQDLEIKIGDANMLVSGQKIYIINYTIKRAINYFDTYDEFYWNATGNGWPVAIKKTTVKVSLPQNVDKGLLRSECFVGIFGSQEKCLNNLADSSGFYSANRELASGEGLTVVFGFPKGIVKEPSTGEKFLETLKDNGILFLPIIILGVMLWLWRKKGRDPEGRGTIIAQYDAPDNLTPLEVGTVVDEKADKKDLSAEIIYLAVRGYLKIKKLEKKIFLTGKNDFQLEKIKDYDGENIVDQNLISGIFNKKTSVLISELEKKSNKDLRSLKKETYIAVTDKGYFTKNPNKTRYIYQVIGLFLIVPPFFLLDGSMAITLITACSLISSGIIVFTFSFLMPQKTLKGVAAKEYILGLKEYLSVAEKDRLKFHNAPDKNPERFEKLLPYAMVLGVEKEWAEQFQDIFKQNPAWYEDGTGSPTAFNSLIFVNSLNSFSDSANASLASSPSSGSSGGSGFSGGGSGGGFGGGGGGSW